MTSTCRFVEAIREQGILRYFPNRTETDFSSGCRAIAPELQNDGYSITPDVTVTRLLSRVKSQAQESPSGLLARLRRLRPGVWRANRRI